MRFALRVLKWSLVAAALSFCAYNAAMSARFWFNLYADDDFARRLFVGASVGASLFKLGIPVVVHAQGQRWKNHRMLALMWSVALAFDLLSSYGYSKQSAGNISADAAEAARQRSEITKDVADRQRKLAQIPDSVRAVAIVRADLRPHELTSGRCSDAWRAKTDACQTVFKLQTELAQAEARDALEAEIALRQKRLREMPVPRNADPTRQLIQDATGVSEEAAARLKALLMVALLELSPIAVLGWAAKPPPAPLTPPTSRKPAAPRAPRAASPPRKAGAADVFALLRGSAPGVDGWIGPVSQRSLAGQLGISPAEVNRQIKALVADGSAEMRAGKAGTALRFTSKATNVQVLRPRP